jgi:hypothetical protein
MCKYIYHLFIKPYSIICMQDLKFSCWSHLISLITLLKYFLTQTLDNNCFHYILQKYILCSKCIVVLGETHGGFWKFVNFWLCELTCHGRFCCSPSGGGGFIAFMFLLVAIPLLETFLQTLNHDFKWCLHVLIYVLYWLSPLKVAFTFGTNWWLTGVGVEVQGHCQ